MAGSSCSFILDLSDYREGDNILEYFGVNGLSEDEMEFMEEFLLYRILPIEDNLAMIRSILSGRASIVMAWAVAQEEDPEHADLYKDGREIEKEETVSVLIETKGKNLRFFEAGTAIMYAYFDIPDALCEKLENLSEAESIFTRNTVVFSNL